MLHRHRSRRFHIYVANRAQFIRARTNLNNWHYIETNANPADLASRGVTGADLVASKLWWEGPAILEKIECPELPKLKLDQNDPEIKESKLVLRVESSEKTKTWLQSLLERAGSWRRITGVMAAVLKFVARLRSAVANCKSSALPESSVNFRVEAERLLIRLDQLEQYPDEMKSLSRFKGKQLSDKEVKQCEQLLNTSPGLSRLDVFMDEYGVMRVGGRLKRMSAPRCIVHPTLIARRGSITRLIVEHFHQQAAHMGAMTSLNALRQAGYWLPQGRSTINFYPHKYVICRRIRRGFQQQKMADLPEERLEETAPFTHVATNCFGPFFIKHGRGTVKYWCCVFVCMGTRAVHIEPIEGMDTSAYINAYRRFVARRGLIRTMFCDRGTNYVGAQAELNKALEDVDMENVEAHLLNDGVDCVNYKFNYPQSSHMAGSWERLIRTIRSAMAHVLLQHGEYLPREVFLTMVVEAEALVNQRPITAVAEAEAADPMPLCPAQLLTMKNGVVKPLPGRFLSAEGYSKKRWKYVQYLLEQFWQRWRQEYLQNLQACEKWTLSRQDLRVGDLVLLHEANIPRGCWPKGIITEVKPSRDSRVRKVTVKTVNGEYKRPIHKLVFLYRDNQETWDSSSV